MPATSNPDSRELPLLLNGPMVRAALAKDKTQTRRPVKFDRARNAPLWARLLDEPPNPDEIFYEGPCSKHARGHYFTPDDSGMGLPENDACVTSPLGQVGDMLWVRETFTVEDFPDEGKRIVWQADMAAAWLGAMTDVFYLPTNYQPARRWPPTQRRWEPSILMPRWASRIIFEVTELRVQRVQDISEEDAKAEGVAPCGGFSTTSGCWMNYGQSGPSCSTARESFRTLWISIYGQESWDRNDWVWAATYDLAGHLGEGPAVAAVERK